MAVVGVVFGFVLLIVPGLVALRSYRRWQARITPEPTFAWSMAVAGGTALVFVPVFLVLPVVAVLLALFVGAPAARPRRSSPLIEVCHRLR